MRKAVKAFSVNQCKGHILFPSEFSCDVTLLYIPNSLRDALFYSFHFSVILVTFGGIPNQSKAEEMVSHMQKNVITCYPFSLIGW